MNLELADRLPVDAERVENFPALCASLLSAAIEGKAYYYKSRDFDRAERQLEELREMIDSDPQWRENVIAYRMNTRLVLRPMGKRIAGFLRSQGGDVWTKP